MHSLARDVGSKCCHLGLRAFGIHARSQARYNRIVPSFVYENGLRNIEFCLIIRKAESWRHNAYNFVMAYVDRDLFSDDIGASAKQVLPGSVAQHDVGRFVGPILAWAERSAEQRYGS